MATRGSDWLDLPVTPGAWRWQRVGSESIASFGTGGHDAVWMVCRPGIGIDITLADAPFGDGPVSTTISTSTMVRTLAAQARRGDPPLAPTVTLAARDPLLDAMAFSRGRFVIAAQGAAPLVLPAWPEVSRVIEDCRS